MVRNHQAGTVVKNRCHHPFRERIIGVMMTILFTCAASMPAYAQKAKTATVSVKKTNVTGNKTGTAETPTDTQKANRAKTLYNNGNSLMDKKDYTGAKKAYDEALEIYRALAEKFPGKYGDNVVYTLNALGILLANQGDSAASEKAFDEASDYSKKLKEKKAETVANNTTVRVPKTDPSAKKQTDSSGNKNNIVPKDTSAYTEKHLAELIMLLEKYHSVGNELKCHQTTTEMVEVCRYLASKDPNKHNDSLSLALMLCGSSYYDLGEKEKDSKKKEAYYQSAEKNFLEGFAIYRKLLAENKEVTVTDLQSGLIYVELGKIKKYQKNYTAMQKYYNQAKAIADKYPNNSESKKISAFMEADGGQTSSSKGKLFGIEIPAIIAMLIGCISGELIRKRRKKRK